MALVTLIAPGSLGNGDIAEFRDRMDAAGLVTGNLGWIDAGDAVDMPVGGDLDLADAAAEPMRVRIDIIFQRVGPRRKMLLVSDMDSTMITVECIDELADYAGIKPEIAAITERAMRGELDFAGALRERVRLLRGLDRSVIATCLAERVALMPGAATLVATMRGWGAHTLLVSGGFTDFTAEVAARIGFDAHHANRLVFADGRFDGSVEDPIVDASVKRTLLLDAAAGLKVAPDAVLAVGDGANDIPMIEAAGMGIAYHAKPAARAAADGAIDHGDLSTLLWAQGVPRREWVAA